VLIGDKSINWVIFTAYSQICIYLLIGGSYEEDNMQT
jgi:hypothetical protein